MIDIESYFISLKASWVSRLADSKFWNWKLIPLRYLNVFGKIWLIFKMNIDVKKPFSKSPIYVFLFTLSGFPFHINLKHLLSIPFLYFSGITHELTIKFYIFEGIMGK
jgi:hypothetical protein